MEKIAVEIKEIVEELNRSEMPVLHINGMMFVDDRYTSEPAYVNWAWLLKGILNTTIRNGKETTYLEIRNIDERRPSLELADHPLIAVIDVSKIQEIWWVDTDGLEKKYVRFHGKLSIVPKIK